MTVSQEEIAKMLGVTRVTVNRALNGSPLVAPEMKEKVKSLCSQLGYHPHYASKTLRSSKSFVISIIRFDVSVSELHGKWIYHLQKEALEAGYMVRLDPASSFEKVSAERSADAFIVFGHPGLYMSNSFLQAAIANGALPIVFVDCPSEVLPTGVVDTDNRGGIIQAVNHLLALGHRQIGYLGAAGDGTGAERFQSYIQRLTDVGIQTSPMQYALHEHWAEDIDKVFELGDGLDKMLNAGTTAIITSSDLYAAGVLKMLKIRNLDVPRDVSVVGYDDSLISRAVEPSLTTVRQDIVTASAMAVDLVLKQLSSSKEQPSKSTKAELVIRCSTANVTTASWS